MKQQCCSTEPNSIYSLWRGYDPTLSDCCVILTVCFNLYCFAALRINIQGHQRCPKPRQAYIYKCVCVWVYSPTKPTAYSQTCSSLSYTWCAWFVHQIRLKEHPGWRWMNDACFFECLYRATLVLLTAKVTWLIPPHLLCCDSNQLFPPSPPSFLSTLVLSILLLCLYF